MDAANEFIGVHNLPPVLKNRVRRYVDYMFIVTRGISTERFSAALPEGLRAEIFMHLHARMVFKVPMFRECERTFIRSVVMKLKAQVR